MNKKERTATFSIILLFVCGLIAFCVIRSSSDAVSRKIYPVKYESIVNEMCEQRNLPKSLVYAIIKTESNFQEDAVSPVGAKGLMQLMPQTFEWIQEVEHGEVLYEQEKLLDADINIKYGCILLEFLCFRYSSEYTAVAAYNAGIGNIDSWLLDNKYSKDGTTLSKIPFSETHHYVERIIKNREKYKEIYNFN